MKFDNLKQSLKGRHSHISDKLKSMISRKQQKSFFRNLKHGDRLYQINLQTQIIEETDQD
jgi:hypothetical protein